MPPRLKRYQQTGHLHFITFSCHQRLPLLSDSRAKETFERVLETVRSRHNFVVIGYVVMPEHVHLLLTEPRTLLLASVLRVIKGESAHLLKDGQAHFWQPRYYDFNVFSARKRIEKLRYMHRNPVTRGLVETPHAWPWSSFRHYATGIQGTVTIEPPHPAPAAINPTPRTQRSHQSGCPIHRTAPPCDEWGVNR